MMFAFVSTIFHVWWSASREPAEACLAEPKGHSIDGKTVELKRYGYSYPPGRNDVVVQRGLTMNFMVVSWGELSMSYDSWGFFSWGNGKKQWPASHHVGCFALDPWRPVRPLYGTSFGKTMILWVRFLQWYLAALFGLPVYVLPTRWCNSNHLCL